MYEKIEDLPIIDLDKCIKCYVADEINTLEKQTILRKVVAKTKCGKFIAINSLLKNEVLCWKYAKPQQNIKYLPLESVKEIPNWCFGRWTNYNLRLLCVDETDNTIYVGKELAENADIEKHSLTWAYENNLYIYVNNKTFYFRKESL